MQGEKSFASKKLFGMAASRKKLQGFVLLVFYCLFVFKCSITLRALLEKKQGNRDGLLDMEEEVLLPWQGNTVVQSDRAAIPCGEEYYLFIPLGTGIAAG